MSTFPQISEAEFEVMKIVWNMYLSTQMKLPKSYCLLQTGVLKQFKL